MVDIEVNHFKKELSEYQYYLAKSNRVKDKILELEVRRGIRAVRYDKEYTDGSPNPSLQEERMIDDALKADELNKELNYYKNKIKFITDYLKSSGYGESIMRIHCLRRSTYEKEARRLFMGTKTLKRKVNREIYEYVTGCTDVESFL